MGNPEAVNDRGGLPRVVWTLGWISLLTDLSSEILYPVVPIYLMSVLGVGPGVLGWIEGSAEATASLVKLLAGRLTDRGSRHRSLIAAGYGLSAVSRPFLALCTGWWGVLGCRLADRLGKGVRSVPRDALLAAAAGNQAGRVFGFHRAMDTTGALIGPLLAVALLAGFASRNEPEGFAHIFLLASIPGFLSVLLAITGLEAAPPAARGPGVFALGQESRGPWPRAFIAYLGVVFTFGLGNASNAFLILRARSLGVPGHLVPLAYGLLAATQVAFSLPAGSLSDRIGRPTLLVTGFLLFAAVQWGFGAATAPWHAWALFGGMGLFLALSDGVERAWVADIAPPDRKGTAFGLFHMATGLATLPASVLAGQVWERMGPAAMFRMDAILALVATVLFACSIRLRRPVQ